MSEQDLLHRFTFESLGLRGELVRLGASWRAVLEQHVYPPSVAAQLGQALASVLLLSGTIKFKGALILQISGRGPLRTLVVQATERRTVRGMARWRGTVPEAKLDAIYGDGRLVLTAEAPSGERYQGIVALEGADLSAALEAYFERSEQLATRLWLAADREVAAGLLLQRLPGGGAVPDAWERIGHLAETITVPELLGLPAETLLYRLFHEETVRLYEPEPVAFRCNCSRERVADTLQALGRIELESLLADEGEIAVDCEFCNRRYRFDAVDIERLFAASLVVDQSLSRH